MRNLLLLFAAIASLGGGYWFAQHLRAPPPVDTATAPAVDFELPDLDGISTPIRKWRGKYVLLNFWATWCPPCLEEIPLFNEAQARFGAAGLQIVGVAIDRRADVLAFRRRIPINYPVLLGDNDAMEVMRQYGNRNGGLPFSALIDPDGWVVGRKLGAYSHVELEELLNQRLARPSPASAHS